MVGPLPFTPFTRQVIVDAGDRYETGTFRWWPMAVTFDRGANHEERSGTVKQCARRQTPPIREFLVWARFPFCKITAQSDGTRVTVGDVRFSVASRCATRSNGRFQVSTIADPGARGDVPDGAFRSNR